MIDANAFWTPEASSFGDNRKFDQFFKAAKFITKGQPCYLKNIQNNLSNLHDIMLSLIDSWLMAKLAQVHYENELERRSQVWTWTLSNRKSFLTDPLCQLVEAMIDS